MQWIDVVIGVLMAYNVVMMYHCRQKKDIAGVNVFGFMLVALTVALAS